MKQRIGWHSCRYHEDWLIGFGIYRANNYEEKIFALCLGWGEVGFILYQEED